MKASKSNFLISVVYLNIIYVIVYNVIDIVWFKQKARFQRHETMSRRQHS